MNKIKLGNKDIYYQVFYKNNKNMYLRVKEDKLVITCNPLIKQNQIESFIQKNQDKILKTISNHSVKETLYNRDVFKLFGNDLKIEYKTNALRNGYAIKDGVIQIDFKKNDFDESYVEKIYQKLLLQTVSQIIKDEYDTLNTYFDIEGISFKSQLMKSRFGSCIANKKTIKLNSILARFSLIYLRTILIHEIIHLKEHNHQKGFYKYIYMLIPNYKTIIKSLNQETRKYVI